MNCEKCQDLLSDFIDGSLNPNDYALLAEHLGHCPDCAEVQKDLSVIVTFCREHRGEYDAPTNERALWLRISNHLESDTETLPRTKPVPASGSWWAGLMTRSWELTFPQLAASVATIVVVVSLVTVAGVRRLRHGGPGPEIQASDKTRGISGLPMELRIRQQQQVIDYWNQRVELNKARWSPQMRETFDRNMSVIDAALNDSLRELSRNPHDEVSEEMLNAALNDKAELLKEFAEL